MSQTDPELRRLQERFLHFQKAENIQALVQDREAAVVSRRAATDGMLSPEPYYKFRFRGGRWAREGETLKGPIEHGFDSGGNLVAIDEYYRLLVHYSPDFIEEVRVHYNRPLAIYVKHYYLENGQVVRHHEATDERLASITYTWEGDRLLHREDREIRGRWTRVDDPLDADVILKPYTERVYSYGADGKLDRVTLTGLASKEEIEYQRPQKRQSAATVAKDLEEKLVALIPATVKSAGVTETIYSLFLCYCSSGWNLVPNLCLATVQDREAFNNGDGTYDAETMWYTAELSHALWLDLEDPELPDQWSLFYQLMGTAGDFSACPKLLRRVAKRLNGEDWTGTLSVTDDFIVTAADTSDGWDIQDDLPASVPPKRLSLLKKRSLWA